MNKEEIINLIKNNLKIKWYNYDDEDLYIALVFGEEVISKIHFSTD